MKKVYILSYRGIKGGKSVNMFVTALYKLAPLFPDNVHFFFSEVDKKSPQLHSVPFLIRIFNKFFLKLCDKIGIKDRRTKSELIMDYYYMWLLKFTREDYVLLTTFYTPKCAALAKKDGKEVVYLTPNHNDNIYYEAVNVEKKRLNIDFMDPYSSLYRNKYYNKLLENTTAVVSTMDYVLELFPDRMKKYRIKDLYQKFDYKPKKNYGINKKIRIGMIGHTNTLLKGFQLLTEAASILPNYEVRLVICGNVDNTIKEFVSKYNIDIEYLGFIKNEEKNDFFTSLDILVVPSLYDCGPTTAYEGLECGVPTIVSNGCGVKEYFEKYPDLFVFKTGKAIDLAEKIEYAINNYNEFVEKTIEIKNDFFEKGINKGLSFEELIKTIAQ